MNKSYKLIFIFLIIQPIIDLVTSLTTKYNDSVVSIGALSRTFIMGCLFIYIFQYLLRNKRSILWMFICSFASIAFMLMITFLFKEPFILYEELNFALKTSYYIVMIYTVIILIDKQMINKSLIFQATTVIAFIIGISYWLAILSGTSINSYTYGESGYSGWFYSANELSVIVIILLGLTIVQLSYQKTLSSWIAFIFILSMLPMIGTKTAFYGGMLIIFLYVVYLLVKFNMQLFKQQGHLLFIGIIIFFICLTPFSPIFSNTEQLDMRIKQEHRQIVENTEVHDSSLMTKLLSSRNIYLQVVKDDFMHAQALRKAFGLGYAGDYTTDPKLIEMDFFDLFFSYGIIGTLFLLIPFLYLLRKIIIYPIYLEKVILLFTLSLCFGISFLAGHVILAPSVMTYMAILYLAIGLNNNKNVGGKYDG